MVSESVSDLLIQDNIKKIINAVLGDLPEIKRLIVIYDKGDGDKGFATISRSTGFCGIYEKVGFLEGCQQDLLVNGDQDIDESEDEN